MRKFEKTLPETEVQELNRKFGLIQNRSNQQGDLLEVFTDEPSVITWIKSKGLKEVV